jgi:Tfp pilus assembly protein FimT
MKKLFMMMAVVVMAVMFVACGPSKEEIADKARYIVREAAIATMNEDYARLEAIAAEEEEFCADLSAEELEYYNEQALAAGMELIL